MKIKLWTKYDVGYLPTKRCRKLCYREEEEFIFVDVMEVSKSQLDPAFETDIMIYSYDNRLWREATEDDIHCSNPDKPMTALEALIYAGVTYSTYFGKYDYTSYDEERRENREDVIKRAEKNMNDYLIVDGALYKATYEPMYCIYTFGFGHNHAGIGTSLSIVNWYNPNLSKDAYFNALEYDKALNKALETASKRGDTDSLEFIKNETKIRVFNDKYVTRNPKSEDGGGNELLNNIESVIESSKSAIEAGLLTIALTNIKDF